MGFLDKVKAGAEQVAKQGQDAIDDAQAKRRSNELLRDLGAWYYATQTGRDEGRGAAELARLTGELQAHEAQHGPLGGAPTAPAPMAPAPAPAPGTPPPPPGAMTPPPPPGAVPPPPPGAAPTPPPPPGAVAPPPPPSSPTAPDEVWAPPADAPPAPPAPPASSDPGAF